MSLKRITYASLLATSVGAAGLLSIGIATANAAPATAVTSQHAAPTEKVKPTHHQKKEIGKAAGKQAKHNGLTVG
jgi:Flp pilus assembly protein CpaB